MRVYIWERIQELTDNYHSDGGLVVVAANLQRAIELAEAEGVTFSDKETIPTINYSVVADVEEKVFIFPDAGCC
jgi:hypothetical protein